MFLGVYLNTSKILKIRVAIKRLLIKVKIDSLQECIKVWPIEKVRLELPRIWNTCNVIISCCTRNLKLLISKITFY